MEQDLTNNDDMKSDVEKLLEVANNSKTESSPASESEVAEEVAENLPVEEKEVTVIDQQKMDANTLVLKIKMKGMILAGMVCYININEKKSIKADSIAIAGGTLLAQFETQRAHNTLQDIIFAIKFRGEKYDTGYTSLFNEVLSEEINLKDHITQIIRFAKEDNKQGIIDLLSDIFKYNLTSFFELSIDLEWIKFDVSESEKQEAAIENLYKSAFEVSLVADPLNGTAIYDLKKGKIIYIKFEDKTPMGLQIKKHLVEMAKRENNEEGSPQLLATVKELVSKDEQTIKQMQVIVEITTEIYGKCMVPLSLKVKNYVPKKEVYQTALEEIKKTTDPKPQPVQNDKPKSSSNAGCIFAIIMFILITLIIYFLLR